MRNLKRALSLALAAIMLLGMMVVGASAVSYNDFSDRTEIVNKDAVSMLTTLGVIDGKPDGSYAPEEFVTREQMAKMISVIMNQGSDNNDLFVGVPSGLTDVAGNWALGHINYCYSLGIIAGRGDGRFDPTANVTASEAAKMLLVAAGYNPSSEGFVGADWAVNVNAKASALGIFRNYTKSTMADLNRDDAALLIYNALDIEMIQKYEDGYAINFDDRRTILSAMYGVYKIEGVVVANQWAELDKTESEDAAKAGTTILDDVRQLASTTASTDKNTAIAYGDGIRFDVDTTVDMLGKRVTLYIEKTTILSDSKVLGVALKDDVNVVHSSVETQSTAKDYLKGTGLAVTKDTEFYVNYGFCKDADAAWALINDHYAPQIKDGKFNLNGVEMEIIDHNNDGDVDYVLFRRETLSKVSAYSEKNETISFTVPALDKDRKLPTAAPLSKTTKVEFADVVFNDDVTTDDLILYIQYGGRTYISIPEIVTGTMSRVDRDKNDELYITVEGETYKQSYIHEVASLVDVDIDHFDIEKAKTNPGFTTKYDFILDSNGFVSAIRPAEETVTNYALVLDSAWTQNALEVKGQVKILKADGTEATYYINWNNSAKALSADGKTSNAASKKALETYLGTRDVNDTTTIGYAATGAAAGTVITYTLSDDNVLTIQKIMGKNTVDRNNNITDVSPNANRVEYGTTRRLNGVVYMNNYETQTGMDDVLGADYDAGDGFVTTNNNKTYAIDKNTIAFYYDVVDLLDVIPDGTALGTTGYKEGDVVAGHTITEEEANSGATGTGRYYDTTNAEPMYNVGKVFYGVAVGWDHMCDVKVNADYDTGLQVYPVVTKTNQGGTEITKLAEVVLFNAKTTNTSANWLFVLSANALSSKVLELNVIFEDGTAKAIEVSRSDYESYFDDEDDFMTAYKYIENADGTYDLVTNSARTPGIAKLLRDGTLDVKGNLIDSSVDYIYPTITGKTQIWNVTDLHNVSDGDAQPGKFVLNENLNAVLIYNNNDDPDEVRTVLTAWVWERDEDTGLDDTSPVTTEVIPPYINEDAGEICLQAFEGATNRMKVVSDWLARNGYTEIEYLGITGNELKFKALNEDKVTINPLVTVTTWYDAKAIGAVKVENYSNSAEVPNYTPVFGGGGEKWENLFDVDDTSEGQEIWAITFDNTGNNSAGVVVTISGSGGPVYKETINDVPNRGIFYFDVKSAASNGNQEIVGSTWDSGKLPNGNYTWTVETTSKTFTGNFTLDH